MPGAGSLGGRLHLAGGYSPSASDNSRELWVYDGVNDVWSTHNSMPAMPAGKSHMNGAVVIDNVFYMVGGYKHGGFSQTSTLFAYGSPA